LHTQGHTDNPQNSSGQEFFPSQRTPLENALHKQDTDYNNPSEIRTRNPKERRPQTHALDRAATEIRKLEAVCIVYCVHCAEVNNSYNIKKMQYSTIYAYNILHNSYMFLHHRPAIFRNMTPKTSINIKHTHVDSTKYVYLLRPILLLYVQRHFGISSPKMAR
jgi:hypothetical protein